MDIHIYNEHIAKMEVSKDPSGYMNSLKKNHLSYNQKKTHTCIYLQIIISSQTWRIKRKLKNTDKEISIGGLI